MIRKPLTLALILAATTAAAAPLPLADNLPAGKDGALSYIGKESKTTAPLALTLKPEGGATVAIIPQGGKVTALISDGKGHTLVANHFGLTGWAQPATAADDNDDFPALEKSELREKDGDPIFNLRYLPTLGKATQETYYLDDNGKQHQGTPPEGKPEEASPYYEVYDHLLDTALKAGGATYRIDCSTGMSDDFYCLFQPAGAARDDAAILSGRDYYLPGNGYVYTDYDDSGSSYYRKRQKWQLDGSTLQEETQPYYALDLASTYRGLGQNQDAPLELHDADGKRVATLAPGDSVTLLLADGQYNCPTEARASDNRCHENRLLLKTADNTLGWVTVNDKQDNAPKFDGLTPSAD